MKSGDILKKEDIEFGSYFETCQDKFICMDNLDLETLTLIAQKEAIENRNFHYVTVVVKGYLNIKVNGIKMKVKEGEMLIVRPNSLVQVLKSRCKFCCYLVQAQMMYNTYKKLGLQLDAEEGCYKFHHYRLTAQKMVQLVTDYNTFKREIARGDIAMRDTMLLNCMQTTLAHFLYMQPKLEEFDHTPKTEAAQVFNTFLKDLYEHFLEDRSVQFYAGLQDLQPKALSLATREYMNKNASTIIDDYVAFRIKLALADGRYNIKQISEMLGFSSQSFFGRYFKRCTGISPLEFVKLHKLQSN